MSAYCMFSRDGGLFIKTWHTVYRDKRGKAWKLVNLHQDDSTSLVTEIWARYFDGDIPVPAAEQPDSKKKEGEGNQEDEPEGGPEEPPVKKHRVGHNKIGDF